MFTAYNRAYPTLLSLRSNSSLRSELRIRSKRYLLIAGREGGVTKKLRDKGHDYANFEYYKYSVLLPMLRLYLLCDSKQYGFESEG